MGLFFEVGSNGDYVQDVLFTKNPDTSKYIKDPIPSGMLKPRWDFTNNIWIDIATPNEITEQYVKIKNSFIFVMKKALWIKFNKEKDWQCIRQRDEMDMGISEINRSLTPAEYTILLQEKWAIRNAVSQLEYYIGYMNADILFLAGNFNLSNAMDNNIIEKDLTPIEVKYIPFNNDTVTLNNTTLSIGAVDITNIIKGDFIFVCDGTLKRVNVFTDTAVTDLSIYTSIQLWGWIGVQKIKYGIGI